MPNKFDTLAAKLQSRINSAMRAMPRIIGNEAVNFYLDKFEQQGWQGNNGLQKWRQRQRETKKSQGKPVLVASGALRRSIRITSIMTNAVHIGTNMPYARVHNDGGSCDLLSLFELTLVIDNFNFVSWCSYSVVICFHSLN